MRNTRTLSNGCVSIPRLSAQNVFQILQIASLSEFEREFASGFGNPGMLKAKSRELSEFEQQNQEHSLKHCFKRSVKRCTLHVADARYTLRITANFERSSMLQCKYQILSSKVGKASRLRVMLPPAAFGLPAPAGSGRS